MYFANNGLFLFLKHNVGMTERLVDNEGFPRNDIDVYQVRTARNKIICRFSDVNIGDNDL